VTSYAAADGLSADNTYPILEDRQGTIWIGGWMGLTQYRDGEFGSMSRAFGVEGKNVMALFEDRDGAMWIGLWGFGGVSRVVNGTVDDFGRREPAGRLVRAITQDASGDMWFGGSEGLTKYSGGVFRRFGAADGFSGGVVHALHAGRDGRLWIGTDAGLSSFQSGRFTHYGPAVGFTGNVVRSIYEDRDGVVWAGTYDTGLFRYADGRLTRFTTREGLFDNGAFQILEDARGNFWISSNAGIYRVSRAALNAVATGAAKNRGFHSVRQARRHEHRRVQRRRAAGGHPRPRRAPVVSHPEGRRRDRCRSACRQHARAAGRDHWTHDRSPGHVADGRAGAD
jgi:hypothetical protein